MGNSTGKVWRNPEDDLIRGRYENNIRIPEQTGRPLDADPLYRPPPPLSETDAEMQSQSRVQSMDCVMDTVEFVKWPAFLGLLWGATMASVHAKPDIRNVRRSVGSGWVLAFRGLMNEAKYLRGPTLFLGGFAAVYSLSSCTFAKLNGGDGVLNSALAGGITGIGVGLYKRSPNLMAMYGVYGAAIAALAKWYYLDPRTQRPRLTYYELVENRKRMLRPEFREQAAHDGYLHKHLDPQLQKLGVQLPESWSTSPPSVSEH